MFPEMEALPRRLVLVLPTTGKAVRTARETTEQVVTEWGISLSHPSVGPALLIVSELVTNSVRHTATVCEALTVLYAAGRDTFAFAVHDRHPHRPPLYTAAPGSGLATVTELTLELGGTAVIRADTDGRGKTIWITLPL
ncbi:ATPase [Streptomyces inusitatus]|uniref:ATPase n=1 Tax=Streptomyces inusitatus TaxID=68221 RepID=A0A918UWX4_9ACTN|nr:ATP-binding protein [Streptomyces inusitatus]GGZ39607.1 ATPase [Streptomyces inusitatus]